MAILTKKMIFQRSTTFFAHFVRFLFLILFFFFSHPTHACVTFCCVGQNSSVGGLLHQIADAGPQNFSKSDISHLARLTLGVFTLNKNIKNELASENQLPTFEKKQLNKNTI